MTGYCVRSTVKVHTQMVRCQRNDGKAECALRKFLKRRLSLKLNQSARSKAELKYKMRKYEFIIYISYYYPSQPSPTHVTVRDTARLETLLNPSESWEIYIFQENESKPTQSGRLSRSPLAAVGLRHLPTTIWCHLVRI